MFKNFKHRFASMIKMKCLIFSFQWYPYMCYVMSGRPWKSSLKFLAKNFGKHFKGLPEIKEQNQLHIWNQHEKYYKIWYFQNANPKFAEKNLSNAYLESACKKLPNVMLSEILIFYHYVLLRGKNIIPALTIKHR